MLLSSARVSQRCRQSVCMIEIGPCLRWLLSGRTQYRRIARRYDCGFNPAIFSDIRPSGPSWQRQSMNLLQHNNIDKRWFWLAAVLGYCWCSQSVRWLSSPVSAETLERKTQTYLLPSFLAEIPDRQTVHQTDRQPVSQAIRQSMAVKQAVSQSGTCSLTETLALFIISWFWTVTNRGDPSVMQSMSN